MKNETESRKAFEARLNSGETVYWVGTAKKPGLFAKKLDCAVTDERVIFLSGSKAESIPYSMVEDEGYVPPEVKTEEDIENLREFCTVVSENGYVVIRGVDGEELFRIQPEGAGEAFSLIKKFCAKQNGI